jgi:hypothetical protein
MVIGAMMDARGAEFNRIVGWCGKEVSHAVIPDGAADPGSFDENGTIFPPLLRGGIEGGVAKSEHRARHDHQRASYPVITGLVPVIPIR